jgi:hypothetical protein
MSTNGAPVLGGIFDASWFVIMACGVAFALGVFPVLHHLLFGLPERRREIVGYFDPRAIKLYFEHFYRAELPRLEKERDLERALERLYNQRFGRRTYVLPIVSYFAALAILVGAVAYGVIVGPIQWAEASLDKMGLYALAGGYLWVVFDIIARYRQRDLVPSALYGYSFRLLICIPLAYTVATILPQSAVPPIAFCLGVFPTNTLMLFLRRQAAQRLGLGEDTEREKLELEALSGVNTTLAEKLAEIGVMTMLQLAYEDPIQLAMRTNLPFAFVVDLISQALGNVYGLKIETAEKFSIRGSIEAAELFEALRGDFGTQAKKDADIIINELASAYQVKKTIMKKFLEDVYNDPYNDLIRNIWA